MRTSAVVASLALAASAVSAQNSTANATAYATGLLAALQGAGLTYLSTAIASLPAAPMIAQTLMMGNYTVLAPSDAAFQTSLNVSSVEELQAVPSDVLTATILYHVLQGAIPPAALGNGTVQLARSLLSNASYVQLGGRNTTQAVLLQRTSPSNVSVLQTSMPVAYANTTYRNLNVYVVDKVLSIPANLTTVAAQTSPVLLQALGMFPGLGAALASIRGITVFAPQDDVLTAALPTLASLNSTQATNVLANHILNGTVAYSPLLRNNMTVISASGQPLTVNVNMTGVFVTSGNITARVVQPNVLTSNGVIHVIDRVLVNTASNPQAAQSAASVAASMAASPTASGAPGAVNSSTPSTTTRASGAAAAFSLHGSSALAVTGLVAGGLALLL